MAVVSDIFPAAIAHHQAGRLDEARHLYRHILAVDPNDVAVLNNLGLISNDAEAEALFRRAHTLRPDVPDAANSLFALLGRIGITAFLAGDYAKALSHLEQAHALRPEVEEILKTLFAAHHNEGLRLAGCGRLIAAMPHLERALGIESEHPDALNILGVALQKQRRLPEAIERYRQALCLRPDSSEALLNLGTALQEQGKPAEAIEQYERAILVKPDFAAPYGNMACALRDLGQSEQVLARFDRALALNPNEPEIIQSRLFSLTYLDSLSAEAVATEHVRGGAVLMAGIADAKPAPDRQPRRGRLRVGYVSPDFRRHPVSRFLEPLLAAHDRAGFEIVCYAEVFTPDDVTARLRGYADRWRDTAGVSDAALAETIRADGIDILVDLAGHTRGNRLPVFALRPAPVQVNWLGYPNSTGFPTIDYRLVDAITDPPGRAETLATERLIRLEGGFLCFGTAESPAPPGALPSTASGAITFGSFNNPSKLSPSTIETWSAILHRLPEARLLLKGLQLSDAAVRALLHARFAERGIPAGRLDMMGFLPDAASHLEAYGRVDIALDPFPYNGTTTTCEALWMGVPVVTLLGDRHAGRVGLEALIARDREAYVECAVALACDRERLLGLHSDLRRRMTASRLCDAAAFARTVERAYLDMAAAASAS